MAYYNPTHEGQPQVQYQAPIVYNAAPAITYQPAANKHYGPHYKKETSTGLGATQIVVAFISITAGILSLVYEAQYWYVGTGIWAGAWYLTAGSVAIAAGHNATNKLITATLVCSVFDILFGITEVTMAALALHKYSRVEAIVASSLMIIAGCLEIIFGIWLVAISARAMTKGSKAQHATVPVAYAPNQPQPVFIQAHPTFQPQPPSIQQQPPTYYVQQQYPSTSNQQQMMYVGEQQAPPTDAKF